LPSQDLQPLDERSQQDVSDDDEPLEVLVTTDPPARTQP
jgi:hypothetical protein